MNIRNREALTTYIVRASVDQDTLQIIILNKIADVIVCFFCVRR